MNRMCILYVGLSMLNIWHYCYTFLLHILNHNFNLAVRNVICVHFYYSTAKRSHLIIWNNFDCLFSNWLINVRSLELSKFNLIMWLREKTFKISCKPILKIGRFKRHIYNNVTCPNQTNVEPFIMEIARWHWHLGTCFFHDLI